ncbi:hypothetical protein [Thermomonas hydrothermalis]|uniref:hypothetical protein n=1 Tax=Thermomonas hydrothermalis TaxID=213588 RepID=UPI0011602592|nr:hypothetical protein [Thermomonas hydrothermalis]
MPKPPGLDPEDQPPHHPKDPLPPTPRPLPRAVDVPTSPHIPKDPGMGDGTPAPGGNSDDPTRNTTRQAEGGTPTSAPTHTVPVAPANRITIKSKSPRYYAPQPPVSIEERTANSGRDQYGVEPAKMAPGMGKPNAGALGATPYQPKCPPGQLWVWVNGDPRGDKRGHCEIPKD